MKLKNMIIRLGILASLTLNASAVTTVFNISTADIGTSTDSDFYITGTDKNTLVNNATLTIGSLSAGNNDFRAFLGFDLTGLLTNGTVTNARLRLFRNTAGNTDLFGKSNVFALTSAFVPGGTTTDYDELTGTLLGDISPGDIATAAYVELDVTAIVENWRLNNLTNYFGFAMQGEEGFTQSGKQFQSSTGANVPQLVVTQIPEPSAALLGLAGACMLIRRRRQN